MKKYLIGLLAVLLIPMMVFAKDEKVKVYIFEAGGCPYCEMELEYLEGLDSYNEKFVVVKKELYVDHNDWAPGEDFIVGAKTALAFNDAGFSNAGYNGTPFVVISDLYASASYSTSLESVINEAYEKGDKDVVGCISAGKNKCLEDYVDADYEKEAQEALEQTITGQISACLKSGGDSSCTDIYKDTRHAKKAEELYDLSKDIYTCVQDGGDTECASEYADSDNEDLAYIAYQTIISAGNTQTSTPIDASKKISPVAIVVVVLSSLVVLGLLIAGAIHLNKEEKN